MYWSWLYCRCVYLSISLLTKPMFSWDGRWADVNDRSDAVGQLWCMVTCEQWPGNTMLSQYSTSTYQTLDTISMNRTLYSVIIGWTWLESWVCCCWVSSHPRQWWCRPRWWPHPCDLSCPGGWHPLCGECCVFWSTQVMVWWLCSWILFFASFLFVLLLSLELKCIQLQLYSEGDFSVQNKCSLCVILWKVGIFALLYTLRGATLDH